MPSCCTKNSLKRCARAKKRDEVAAGGGADEREPRRVEAVGGGVRAHPAERSLHILDARGKRMRGREPVVDAKPRVARALEGREDPRHVLALVAARPAAAVDDHGGGMRAGAGGDEGVEEERRVGGRASELDVGEAGFVRCQNPQTGWPQKTQSSEGDGSSQGAYRRTEDACRDDGVLGVFRGHWIFSRRGGLQNAKRLVRIHSRGSLKR
jgi:hypothetical protein